MLLPRVAQPVIRIRGLLLFHIRPFTLVISVCYYKFPRWSESLNVANVQTIVKFFFCSCHQDNYVVNEIFSPLILKIEELKNENALLRAQLQQHGIELVGETPPQWRRDDNICQNQSDAKSTQWKRRQDNGENDLWRTTFFLVNASFLGFPGCEPLNGQLWLYLTVPVLLR